jgi:hypothetical protein
MLTRLTLEGTVLGTVKGATDVAPFVTLRLFGGLDGN